ncbi:transmembrane sensor [Pedobacter sp. UYP30]|uniref:FecR family protein n=1 Tax=Pedobacter sp. UYP30 TaxID=1756400 RepID=UPI0033977242
MTTEEFKQLYNKYLLGKCTAEEQKIVELYCDGFDLSDIPWTDEMGDPISINKEMINDMNRRLKQRKFSKVKLSYWASAAAILIISCMAVFISQHKSTDFHNATKLVKNSIEPGKNKAILTLANGNKVVLDDRKQGIVSNQGNVSVTKNGSGEITYQENADDSKSENLKNSISTPRGGQYNLVLADGTKVFLNAASTLIYPTCFNGNERRVKLIGEAYFEVAKNKNKPFKVDVAGQQEVKVLGTHFNISAYPDDNHISTTLLEGSIKLSNSNYETVLKPGEQAVQNVNSSKVVVSQTDVEEAIAWKKGYFRFQNENIRDIMKGVSRWYDVDVKFEGPLSNRTFGGMYLREKKLAGLLDLLEYTGYVSFKVEGRRITVITK